MRRLNHLAALRRPSCLAAVLAIAVVIPLATLSTPPRRHAPPTASTAPAAHDVLANLPVSFEPAGEHGFVSRGPGYSLSLSSADAVIALRDATFRLRPAGPTANPAATLEPTEPLAGTVTRLVGNDPSAWSAGLSTFGRVEARQVWPGIDMAWHGDQRRLEHDMVVAPGVDPSVVALDVDGAQSIDLEPGGDLILNLGATTARMARPVVYQDVAGMRREVAGAFTLLGPLRIGFRLGAYDTTLPLIIDPTLVTSAFLGGIGNDDGYGIAVDAEGNTYVTGATESTDFPTNAPLQTALSSPGTATSDVFVSKISPDGSRLIWSTYLGGQGRDTGYAVAVAIDGTVYVAGVTESPDFPSARAPQATYGGGPSDAFVAKIASNGAGLEWSTFLGGGQTDRARGLAVDISGNAFVTGSTSSTDFPSVNPQQPGPFRPDDLDAFVVKIPAVGSRLTFATRLGGSNDDRGLAVAVDIGGNAYVTGDTLSPGFPTVKPFQATSGGSASGVAGSFPDAFVAKYNPSGSALIYSTFLGGSGGDQGTSIAIDGQGAAYVAGNTNSPNFPTVGPLQATKGNDSDAFVSKLDPAGDTLVYSTYFGGSGADGANGIAVDRTGSAHVVGTTGSTNWVTARPTQPAKAGGDDAFVVRLDSTGRGPLFSTFLGGREADAAMGVALDGQGGVHVLGLSSSADFPSVKPFQGSRPAVGGDAFVATLSLADVAAPTTVASGTAAAQAASSTSAHDRRVRLLFLVTMALLLAGVAQTLFLRRRAAAAPASKGRARPTPAPPSARPGVQVLAESSPKQPAPSAKAPMPPRSNRTPKTRGGPKTGASKPGGNRKTPSRPGAETAAAPALDAPELTEAVEAVESVRIVEDGGPPTVVSPPPTPPAPKGKPQAPAIANLLEEDLWAPEGPAFGEPAPAPGLAPDDADPDDAGPADAAPAVDQPVAAPQWAPFDTGSTAAVEASPAPFGEPGPPIPPVPAEELSFWDLFPEDLPPARATAFPAEDLLADYLALPEGADSVAERLAGPPSTPREEPPAPAEAPYPPDSGDAFDPPAAVRPPPPPEAELVIAELLDGPLPSGRRPSAESPWAPRAPGDDFVIDELLANQAASPGTGAGTGTDNDDDDGADDMAAAAQARTPQEQARIAADRARRRRSRRGGRRKPPTAG